MDAAYTHTTIPKNIGAACIKLEKWFERKSFNLCFFIIFLLRATIYFFHNHEALCITSNFYIFGNLFAFSFS